MRVDLLWDKYLVAFLEASERHAEAVEEMLHLAMHDRHREFVIAAAQARRLAVQSEAAYSALLKRKIEASTNI